RLAERHAGRSHQHQRCGQFLRHVRLPDHLHATGRRRLLRDKTALRMNTASMVFFMLLTVVATLRGRVAVSCLAPARSLDSSHRWTVPSGHFASVTPTHRRLTMAHAAGTTGERKPGCGAGTEHSEVMRVAPRGRPQCAPNQNSYGTSAVVAVL